MPTFIHADIFFFVATIAVAVVAVLFVILFIYIVQIVARVKRLTEKANAEGDFLFGELHELALRMKMKRFGFVTLYKFIHSIIRRYS